MTRRRNQERAQRWVTTHGALICARAHELVRAGAVLEDLCVLIFPREGRLVVEATLRNVLALELRRLGARYWLECLATPVHPGCVRVFATRDGAERTMFDLPVTAHAAPIDEAVH